MTVCLVGVGEGKGVAWSTDVDSFCSERTTICGHEHDRISDGDTPACHD